LSRVYFDAVVSRERLPQQVAMLGEHRAVPLAEPRHRSVEASTSVKSRVTVPVVDATTTGIFAASTRRGNAPRR
jgi:hypothetical protein